MAAIDRADDPDAVRVPVGQLSAGAKTPSGEVFRLAKVVGVVAVVASAVSQEYGSGINFVAPQSVGVYPRIEGLGALAMFVTGVALLPKVALFMRFSRHIPRAGSSYTWLSRTLSLPVAFVITFLWWIGLAGAIGVIAYAFGTFLAAAVKAASLPGAAAIATNNGHLVVGLLAIWVIYAVHVRGVAAYGKLMIVLIGLIGVTAAVLVGYALATPASHFVAAAQHSSGLRLAPPPAGLHPTVGAFISVCTLFVFAYGGLSAAPTLGGEAREAERTIPRGIFGGWAVAIVLFTLVTYAIDKVAPWWAVHTLVAQKHSGLTTAPGIVSLITPRAVSIFVNFATAIIVGKTLAPQLLACSRTLFGWGQDRVFPRVFATTSARKSPIAALTASAVVGSLFLVQTTYEGFTLGVIIRSLSILVILAALGVGVLNVRFGQRARFIGRDWAQAVGRGPGVVVAAVLAIVVAAVFVQSVLTVAHKALVFQPWFQAVVTIVIGALVYVAAAGTAKQHGTSLSQLAAEPPVE